MLKGLKKALENRLFQSQAPQPHQQKQSRVASLIAENVLGKPVWTPRRYENLSYEGYQKNIIVFRAVSLVAQGAASVPWRLFEQQEEILQHPLLDLLHHPNPNQGGASFIESVLTYKLLAGNSYVEAITDEAGQPVELYTLRPDRMQVVPGKCGIPEAYIYTVGGRSRQIPVNILDGKSDILHLKTFHPLNDWYGMSPLEAAAQGVDQHNEVSAHNLSLLQNGGRPSGMLHINARTDDPTPLTADQRDTLKNELSSAYEGSLNAGRIMVLEGDIQWKELGLSPKDLDFSEGKRLSAREISQAFGVPPMLVGVPGDATFANYREARLNLWEDTILPLLDGLCDEFNHWLTSRYGKDLKLQFDIDGIPALSERRENIWKKMKDVNFLTVNEKRRACGYAPVEKGDEL